MSVDFFRLFLFRKKFQRIKNPFNTLSEQFKMTGWKIVLSSGIKLQKVRHYEWR